MKKTIFEEMGGTYVRQGDYLIPCLTLLAEEKIKPIGQSACFQTPFAAAYNP